MYYCSSYSHCCDGMRPCLCGTAAANGPVVCPHPTRCTKPYWTVLERYWQGKPKDSEVLCQCHFVHKSHLNCLEANPGLCFVKPATNRLSYDIAASPNYFIFCSAVCSQEPYWIQLYLRINCRLQLCERLKTVPNSVVVALWFYWSNRIRQNK